MFLLIIYSKNMVRANTLPRRARITQKKKRQWSAREKLMIIAYYEREHSK